MRLFFIGLLVYAGMLLAFGTWVVQANAATVERHAICWTGNQWRIWQPVNHRWKGSQRPCKRLWAKGWAVIRDGTVIGIHKERTLVGDLPAVPPLEES